MTNRKKKKEKSKRKPERNPNVLLGQPALKNRSDIWCVSVRNRRKTRQIGNTYYQHL
jgi:hypothetical protein